MPLHKDPQKQSDIDERGQEKSAVLTRSAFRSALPKAIEIRKELRVAFPAKDEDTKIKIERQLLKSLGALPEIQNFLTTAFAGGESQEPFRRKALGLLRDVAAGKQPLLQALKLLDELAKASYRTRNLEESRAPLQKLPPEILEFLPKNLVVEVDPDGVISRVTERFGNESRTIEVKINKMKKIVRQYNQIVRQIKRDLVSPDEITRLAAIVTSIIMETGIRPGAIGNAATIHAGGEEVEVETFGATTLTLGHLEFVKDNFVKLEFIGKKGTLNVAQITDENLIRILREYAAKAAAGGSKYIFVTSTGEQFTYAHLKKYFASNFAGIDPTDFRKLRAAETIFTELKNSQEELYRRIREFVGEEEQALKIKVLAAIRATLAEAIEKSRAALSHKSQAETIDSYLDPRITLQFLSRGEMAKTLHEAILDDDTVLTFDPQKFVERASAKSVAAKWIRKASGQKTLRELLEELEQQI